MSLPPFSILQERRDSTSQPSRTDEPSKLPRGNPSDEARGLRDVDMMMKDTLPAFLVPPVISPMQLGRPLPSAQSTSPWTTTIAQPQSLQSDPTTSDLLPRQFENLGISAGPSHHAASEHHSRAIPEDSRPPPLPPRQASAKGKERATILDSKGDLLYWRRYVSEDDDMEDIIRLTEQELSEPYNIFTFRYFLDEWPDLTIMVYSSPEDLRAIATVIAKRESHRDKTMRGYIAMLSVDRAWRRRGIASRIVGLLMDVMREQGVDEVVLETEYDNVASLALYASLGFIREKRLHRFYTNGKDAFRLILPFESDDPIDETASEAEMARWLIGAGPEEDLMIPHAPETNEAEMVRRSGTPMPSSGATAFNDLYA